MPYQDIRIEKKTFDLPKNIVYSYILRAPRWWELDNEARFFIAIFFQTLYILFAFCFVCLFFIA